MPAKLPPVIGTDSQENLVKMYGEFVSKSKVKLFKKYGFNIIQGRREGIYIEALEGIRGHPPLKLIDCRTSGGVFNLGHRHPVVIQALKDAIDGGLDIGDHHLLSEQRALLAKQLAGLLPPGISKTLFCVGGGEAVDLAIKIARGHTKRKKVISAVGGYHGVTGVALATGDRRFKDTFLWDIPGFQQVPFGDVDALESAIDDETACVIMETIPATAGILIPPEGYFPAIRELCDARGAVMIADEVQAGLGRTGEMWGIYGGLYPEEKVIPDIIVLAKGMTGSMYPLATCSFRPFLEDIFKDDPFLHISTTGGSEIGCYVARKMLEVIAQPEMLAHVKEMGALLGDGLQALKEKYTNIVDVRGRGLMWGLEFNHALLGQLNMVGMVQNGLLADYCGNRESTDKFMPPFIVEAEDIQEILARLEASLVKLPASLEGM
ncbi:MAG TPA: aspartate aminotransferase family protein [Candidatus Lokiarchaeia archaeon]|nr:aspartate aminotransferase family protein [Candidatus Lokiarchaeia archaeon]